MSESLERARSVFGRRAAFYRDSPAHTDPTVLKRLVEMAEPQPGWQALDVAAGPGHAALALAPHVRRVTAIDVTPEMLRQAKSPREERSAANLMLCQGDAAALPTAGGVYDLVVCRRAAHHFVDLHGALLEMRRVLRPGGRLVIDDRSVPQDPDVDRTMNRLDRLHDQSHVREYPAETWPAMLRAAGFEPKAVETYHRLRPIGALTHGTSSRETGEIARAVESMPAGLARAFGREKVDGEWHILHWYVLLCAERAPALG
jgi:ubiquinone/menaquinone biosynthesis C-methylase UbiE